MSVINKMLQELDRRNAMAGAEATPPPRQVKPVGPARRSDEWFWRIIAVLVLAAVAWVGWVAYHLQPRTPLATDQALKAQALARKRAAAQPAPPSSPAAPQPVASAPAISVPEAKAQPSESGEIFKLARAIETPITERKPQAIPAEAPKPAAKKALSAQAKPAAPLPGAASSSVDKRDRDKVTSAAEPRFRRAAVLLNQGRVSEAEEQLVGALQADPAHQPARQAYVALLLEQHRMDAARRVLREALEANPTHPTFALTLARIHAEQRDYSAALEVMDRAGSASQNADFQALRGAVLQRLGRHVEAVESYQRAVQGAPQPGSTWAGMGISLEALGRKAEAVQAYHRALGAGTLAKEVREYAEGRVRALD